MMAAYDDGDMPADLAAPAVRGACRAMQFDEMIDEPTKLTRAPPTHLYTRDVLIFPLRRSMWSNAWQARHENTTPKQ